MTFRRIIIFSLLFLGLSSGLNGQPYAFRSLEVEDGLSQNMVYCVLQDRSDFLWIGTQNGLNRYDGSNFRIFKKSYGSLLNDAIFSLREDSDGRLWVGTMQGLHIYNPVRESFRFIPIHDIQGNPVEGIVRDIEFGLDGSAFAVIADTCLVHIDADFSAKQVPLGDTGRGIRIRDMQVDGEGNLWIASYVKGLLELQRGNPERIREFPYSRAADRMFTKVISKDNETLLVGTIEQGVLEFSLRTKSFSPVAGMDGHSVRFVHDLMVDSSGRLWVGAENGLHVRDASGISRLTHASNVPDSISDNAVYCITEDSDGGIWVGTYFGGVNYYSKSSSVFRKFYPVPEANMLKGKNISEFCQAPDGRIWIGTEDAGLHRFNPEDGSFENGFLPAGNIHALKIIDGRLWVGSYGEGLFISDENSAHFKRYLLSEDGSSPGANSIYSIFRDVSGDIWIGTESGLFRYNPSQDRFERVAQGLISRQVNDILQDFHGNIWFATMGQGLLRYTPETGLWYSPPGADSYMTCILEDSSHNLWFGTENSGISFYNSSSGVFEKQWSEDDGLPNNMIYKLLEDKEGGIWGSTNHGLFHISPYRDRVQRFDHSSGLVCDQFNYKSGLKTTDGTIYFGGVKGFVSFRPGEFSSPARRTKLVFNRFLLYNRDVSPGTKGSPLGESVVFTDEITLRPDQKVFSIGFADLDFSPSNVKTYQYRLVGHDRSWINIEGTHLLNFSNLQPGHYRLELRANPLNSFPGDSVKTLEIRVLPPWYMTPWAYGAAGLAVLVLLFLVFRASTRRASERGREAMRREIESQKAASVADLKFLDKVKAIMEDNLANPDLNVNMMADMLHMSRSTFYRKMKGITELSGNDYIRSFRLERAADLLSDNTHPVAEVASLTGFGSVSYFSRSFRERYGVSPKDYKGKDQNR